MSSIIYPSSFAVTPTMTLHNGSAYRAVSYQETSLEAQLDLIMLPNYVLYDPNGTNDAPTLPGAIETDILITETSKAAVLATYVAWVGHTGKRATLTGTTLTGTTKTCTARLKSVKNVGRLQDIRLKLRVHVVFVPLDAWA
jgi:hypothetical protein